MRQFDMVLSRLAAVMAVALLVVANTASKASADDSDYDPDYDGYSFGLRCNIGTTCGTNHPNVKCTGYCFVGSCSCALTPNTPVVTAQCDCV